MAEVECTPGPSSEVKMADADAPSQTRKMADADEPTKKMADANPPTGTKKKRVLFVCGHNAGRSIAAEAIARNSRPDIQVASAGTTATGKVNSAVLDALQAAGVPTDGLRSKSLEDDEVNPLDSWDMMITMGCMQMQCGTALALKAKLSCQAKLEDWGLPDPAEDPAVIPSIIESIQQRVATL